MYKRPPICPRHCWAQITQCILPTPSGGERSFFHFAFDSSPDHSIIFMYDPGDLLIRVRVPGAQIPLITGDEYQVREHRERVERERLTREEFVPVKVAENAFEADRIRAVLEQEGFTVMVRSFHDTAYDGIYQAQKGWGYVEVPQNEKERAERIVNELEQAFSEGEGK